MNLLADLYRITEAGDDLSKLPKDVVSAIKKNIRKGAEDIDLKWGNALELVHKAYEVEGVERPDPTMKTAWQQYEEHLTYAVSQLADNRGMDADWRMSSAMFHEAMNPTTSKFHVTINKAGKKVKSVVEAHNTREVINTLTEKVDNDVRTYATKEGTHLEFSKWGIVNKNLSVTIKKA